MHQRIFESMDRMLARKQLVDEKELGEATNVGQRPSELVEVEQIDGELRDRCSWRGVPGRDQVCS